MLLSSQIPLLMVVFFLLFTLGVAYRFTKSSPSFQTYAIGDKQFSTGYLVITLLSTTYGGGMLFRNMELIHCYGLYCMLVLLFANFLVYWSISLLALRMDPFMRHLSMSETIGYVYGTKPRIIASLAYIFSAIPCILIQIHVITFAIDMCLDSVNPNLLITIVIVSFILYTSIGGIRAIMVTDIVQLFAFCTILPFFAWWTFTKTGKSLGELFSFVQAREQFQFGCMYHGKMQVRPIISLVLPYLVTGITPPIMQKVYMAKDHFQASRVFLITGIVSVCMLFFTLVTGLFTFDIAPDGSLENVLRYILANSPSLLKGSVAIGMLALTMSTADAYLNSCSVILSHDIVETIIGPKIVPYNQQLRLAKYIAFCIGAVVVLFSYRRYHLISFVGFYFDCFVPIVIAPFILAVLGFRGSGYSVLVGMVTGILAILSWNLWVKPIIHMNGSFFCMLANGLATLMSHCLAPITKPVEQNPDAL
ncbi:MAG: sodium:solute symporter family protein [Candidatus Cardinium sp.]|nr:sodium:solute symporter family protein [Candidatus Cardinium sp.]